MVVIIQKVQDLFLMQWESLNFDLCLERIVLFRQSIDPPGRLNDKNKADNIFKSENFKNKGEKLLFIGYNKENEIINKKNNVKDDLLEK